MTDITTSGEDVNTQETTTTPITKEEYEKVKELEKNKSIALKQEREEKNKLSAELEELRKFRSDLEEKEAKKKGQYEELLSKKDEELKSLSEKAKAYDEIIEAKKVETQNKLKEFTEKVGAKVLEENKFILDDLGDEKKVMFLEKLINQNKSFDPETKKTTDKVDKLTLLKDKMKTGKVTPTERADYLNLLRTKKI